MINIRNNVRFNVRDNVRDNVQDTVLSNVENNLKVTKLTHKQLQAAYKLLLDNEI
jgi:hypothetical protein